MKRLLRISSNYDSLALLMILMTLAILNGVIFPLNQNDKIRSDTYQRAMLVTQKSLREAHFQIESSEDVAEVLREGNIQAIKGTLSEIIAQGWIDQVFLYDENCQQILEFSVKSLPTSPCVVNNSQERIISDQIPIMELSSLYQNKFHLKWSVQLDQDWFALKPELVFLFKSFESFNRFLSSPKLIRQWIFDPISQQTVNVLLLCCSLLLSLLVRWRRKNSENREKKLKSLLLGMMPSSHHPLIENSELLENIKNALTQNELKILTLDKELQKNKSDLVTGRNKIKDLQIQVQNLELQIQAREYIEYQSSLIVDGFSRIYSDCERVLEVLKTGLLSSVRQPLSREIYAQVQDQAISLYSFVKNLSHQSVDIKKIFLRWDDLHRLKKWNHREIFTKELFLEISKIFNQKNPARIGYSIPNLQFLNLSEAYRFYALVFEALVLFSNKDLPPIHLRGSLEDGCFSLEFDVMTHAKQWTFFDQDIITRCISRFYVTEPQSVTAVFEGSSLVPLKLSWMVNLTFVDRSRSGVFQPNLQNLDSRGSHPTYA